MERRTGDRSRLSHPEATSDGRRLARRRYGAKAVQTERVLDGVERRLRHAAGVASAVPQDVVDIVRAMRPGSAARADRREQIEQHGLQALLHHRVAMGVERVEIGEHHVALDPAGIADAQVVGIGVQPAHRRADFVVRRRQGEGIALRLAHLGAPVDAGQASARRDRRARLRQQRVSDLTVEAPHDRVGLLDHRGLVGAHRHEGGPERGDVGGLGHGVAQEAGRDVAPEAARLDLVLDRWIALEPRHGDEVEEELRQLAECRQGRLHADRGEARIDSDGEIVQGKVDGVSRDAPGIVGVVAERLRVGDRHERVVTMLEGDAVAQAAAEVTEMERSGRAIARQDDGARVGGDVGHRRFSGWEPPRRESCGIENRPAGQRRQGSSS
jgi:hypothetical protein